VVVGVVTVLLPVVVTGGVGASVCARVAELDEDDFLGFLGGRLSCNKLNWLEISLRRRSSSEMRRTGSSFFFKLSCFLFNSSSHCSAEEIDDSNALSSASVYLEGSPAVVSFFSCSVAEIKKACACTRAIRMSLIALCLPEASWRRVFGAEAARLVERDTKVRKP
jgi:hypothetical protein